MTAVTQILRSLTAAALEKRKYHFHKSPMVTHWVTCPSLNQSQWPAVAQEECRMLIGLGLCQVLYSWCQSHRNHVNIYGRRERSENGCHQERVE